MTRKQTESILKLFAITAHSGYKLEYHEAVKDFLEDNLAEEYIDEYLALFKRLINEHESASSLKKLSLNSVKLIRYCSEIAKEIETEERIYVFVVLNNFIGNEEKINKEQYEFLYLVADEFGIDKTDAENIVKFSEKKYEGVAPKHLTSYKHYNQSKFWILKTNGRYLLIRSDKQELFINSQKCKLGKTYCADYNSVVRVENLRQFTYTELNNLFISRDDIKSFKLDVINLSLKIKDKTILQPVNFSAQSGELVAIIGKSGSGKTSLLSSLAGIKQASGQYYIRKNNSNFQPESSYVNQENVFINSFTVEEHLQDRLNFLQIPSSEHKKKILMALENTELSEHRQKIAIDKDGKFSQLSGGQQKRLNIALSLLQNPELILMDEPASGLSSTEAYRLFALLKTLSLDNKIVICSVHQADISIFNMFDKVIILSPDGRQVFTGKPYEAAEYFRKIDNRVDKQSIYNADYKPGIILEIIEKHQLDTDYSNKSDELLQAAESESNYKKDNKILQQIKSKQNIKQSLSSYLIREWKSILKTPVRTLSFLAIPALLAFILSFLSRYSPGEDYSYYYNPNIPALIIMILTTAFFVGIISTGHEFIDMRKYINSEIRIINKSFSYISSKIIKSLVLSILQSLIISLITVYISGFSDHFLVFFLFIWAMCFTGSVSGLLLSSILKNVSLVYLIVPLLVIPQMLFSGALIDFRHLNNSIRNDKYVPIVASFIPLRWSAEAVMIDLFKNNKYETNLFVDNVNLHEAAYYLNIFIPILEEMLLNDAERAERIIKTENLKNSRFPYIKAFPNRSLEEAKQFYTLLRTHAITERDNTYTQISKAHEIRNKYVNQALNNILLNIFNKNTYELKENEIIREYASVYKLPDENSFRTQLFSPYKKVFNNLVNTTHYNITILILVISMISSILYLRQSIIDI